VYVAAFGPDRCRTDRCAVCAYYGVVSWRRDTTGGWHQPADSTYELDSILSAEDTALLQALMNAGTSQERLEFLG
jgi:hypothetical protein